MTGKSGKNRKALTAGMTVSSALAEVLRSSFDSLTRWESKARSWDDIEGVHQMRVNARRMRSALWSFRSAVPNDVSLRWREELRWLASQLGDARDLDVFIAEGLAPARDQVTLAGRHALMALAEQRRAAAYDVVRAMLDSDRYAQFKREFPEWFRARAWEQADLSEKQRKKLDTKIDRYARKLLERLDARVLETGKNLDKNDAEQMHQLRIECKKLRYAAEFFGPIIPGLDAYLKHLKKLQDVLGTLNDVSVTCCLLKELLAGQSDPELFGCACAMVAWRTREGCTLLASFEKRWQAFAHRRPSKKSAGADRMVRSRR
jgi:CHAD domain-containing protein